jgi:5-deoxy-glucuronate isomerase
MHNLVSPRRDTDLISIDIVRLDPGGPEPVHRERDEILAVVLSGVIDVRVDETALGRAGGRTSVFDSPGHAVYAPPGARLEIAAVGGPAELAVCAAPLADEPAAAARIIGPDDQRIADVGSGNWSRTVRTVLGPEHAAGRLLAGETINPEGNWSSYPPHKHDTHEPPREVALEEVYYFKFAPSDGFGIALRYDGGGEDCATVREGDTEIIKTGYHPVVAAPGYRMYYLWVMAGRGREMAPYLDPRYAWVQTGR